MTAPSSIGALTEERLAVLRGRLQSVADDDHYLPMTIDTGDFRQLLATIEHKDLQVKAMRMTLEAVEAARDAARDGLATLEQRVKESIDVCLSPDAKRAPSAALDHVASALRWAISFVSTTARKP